MDGAANQQHHVLVISAAAMVWPTNLFCPATSNMARCGEYIVGLKPVLTKDLNCVFLKLLRGRHLEGQRP